MMSDLRKNIFSIKIWTVTTFCLLSLVNMNASNTLAHSLQKDEIKVVKDNPGKKVTGKVLDEFGEPIPSASILVEGRSRGVITDLDGTFVIEVLPTDKLVVSFLGMETQTILVGKQTNIVVKMQPQTAELDEVTVVAYGNTNGKTNCSIFKKHFVPGLPLLTQNKMCILLQKNRGNLFSCLYFRSEPSKKVNGWVKCWILPIL